MKVDNNLKRRLEKLGIKSMIPTDELLQNQLGGMTLRRFNKILDNRSERELTLLEARNLTRWLATLLHLPESDINLLESAEPAPGIAAASSPTV